MVVGQNQWYHFGVGAPLILVYFIGDWDVHWGYGLLTHGHIHTRAAQNERASVTQVLVSGSICQGAMLVRFFFATAIRLHPSQLVRRVNGLLGEWGWSRTPQKGLVRV